LPLRRCEVDPGDAQRHGEQAREQALRSARRRLVRARTARVLGLGFVVFFAVGGVLSG